MKLKILAINGSPKGPVGNTDILLQSFLRGAQSASAEIDMVYLKDRTLNHCNGCYTCWEKTPGVCTQKDDMPELLEKVRQADVIVYATPVHAYAVSSMMKVFMERNLPLTKSEHKKMKMVLISNCGLPDRRNFNGLLETFRLMSNPYRELAGTILCPLGPILSVEPLKPLNRWYIDACETAGREFVETGAFSQATQEVLEKPLVVPNRK